MENLIGYFVSGALQILSSEEKDHGKYECVAENSIGTDYSKHSLLYVKGEYVIFQYLQEERFQ